MSDNPAVKQQNENAPQDHPADAALPEKDLGKVVGGGLKGESSDDQHKDWRE